MPPVEVSLSRPGPWASCGRSIELSGPTPVGGKHSGLLWLCTVSVCTVLVDCCGCVLSVCTATVDCCDSILSVCIAAVDYCGCVLSVCIAAVDYCDCILSVCIATVDYCDCILSTQLDRKKTGMYVFLWLIIIYFWHCIFLCTLIPHSVSQFMLFCWCLSPCCFAGVSVHAVLLVSQFMLFFWCLSPCCFSGVSVHAVLLVSQFMLFCWCRSWHEPGPGLLS